MRPGEVVGDRFAVERKVGSGGMGTVYRAVDRETGAPVALKLLHGAALDDKHRFEREATLLGSFAHPAIVAYVAHGRTGDGAGYLVMEWIEGETLEHRMLHDGLTLREAVAVGRAVADALSIAHMTGVVHRDVQPRNILFDGGDLTRAKLIDFGIARRTKDKMRLTLSGMMIGTPGYMAPEQARGVRGIDAGVDVFALGCVLYEMLTGRSPFSGKNPMAIRTKILMTQPPALAHYRPEAPESLRALVDAMLSKDRARRPADAREVAQRLDAIGDLPDTAPQRSASVGLPTTQVNAAPAGGRRISVIMAAHPYQMGSLRDAPSVADLEQQRRGLEAALRRYGATVELLEDRSVVAAVDDAERAATCAQALHELMSGTAVVIATDGDLDGAIDSSARTMEKAVHEDLIARARDESPSFDAVRVCDSTAELLGDRALRQGRGNFLTRDS